MVKIGIKDVAAISRLYNCIAPKPTDMGFIAHMASDRRAQSSGGIDHFGPCEIRDIERDGGEHRLQIRCQPRYRISSSTDRIMQSCTKHHLDHVAPNKPSQCNAGPAGCRCLVLRRQERVDKSRLDKLDAAIRQT